MEAHRILPIGIQDFEKLRTGNCLYVDKTSYVARLAIAEKPYFLSRPRRFGKSLFLSTLKYYFQGRKDLFEGLTIAELEKDWIEYPVFHLDMNVGRVTDMTSFLSTLNTNLRDLEQEWGKDPGDETPAARLDGLIKRAHKQTG
ncbi:MAG: AAA family ATPase, partial [Prevotellaceae bacterium]|nr:AAA family ATPase [Prevotellaceae bacterium]